MNWSIFSKNRKYLMGLAITIVIVFHWCENFKLLLGDTNYTAMFSHIVSFAISKIVWIGACGVEIFLFLSGIGLYFSFTKNSDLKAFYTKRLIAILIPYFIIAVPYLLWQDFIYTNRGFMWFLADLSLFTTFTPINRQSWYVALILIMYIVFPLFYWFMKKQSAVKFIILEAVFCMLPLIVQYFNYDLFKSTEVALTRIPTFILGVYCGRFVYENKKMKFFPFLLVIALAATITIKRIMIYKLDMSVTVVSRYEKAFIMLLLLTAAAYILDKFTLKRTKMFLAFLAPITLELYLTHVQVRRMFARLFLNCWTVSTVNLAFVSIIAISLPISLYVNKLSKKLSGKIKSKKSESIGAYTK